MLLTLSYSWSAFLFPLSFWLDAIKRIIHLITQVKLYLIQTVILMIIRVRKSIFPMKMARNKQDSLTARDLIRILNGTATVVKLFLPHTVVTRQQIFI